MRRFIVILILLGSIVLANDIELKSVIFNKIIIAVTAKERPLVYIYKKNEALEKYPGALEIVSKCRDADVVVLSTLKDLPEACKEKIFFGTRYKHLRDRRVIGSFFWQKGRPNILFYKDRLDKKDIKLDKTFDKYIEE